jgi:hypothetical protein
LNCDALLTPKDKEVKPLSGARKESAWVCPYIEMASQDLDKDAKLMNIIISRKLRNVVIIIS